MNHYWIYLLDKFYHLYKTAFLYKWDFYHLYKTAFLYKWDPKK